MINTASESKCNDRISTDKDLPNGVENYASDIDMNLHERRKNLTNEINLNQTVTQKKRYVNKTNKSKIKVILSTKINNNPLQVRGEEMVERKETFSTPIKIEFNLSTTMQEFNVIKAVKELCNRFSQQDKSIKVFHHDNNQLIWEEKMVLPEDEEFAETFNLREQSFRKGNKKVTLYCIIESIYTINRLKYMEPIKSYIFEHNVWIRPDLYSTKVVGSPGFLTLIHPRLTNKVKLVRDIKKAIGQVKINTEEEVVSDWYTKYHLEPNTTNIFIPTFHMETTTRKWGEIHVEVLTIHCSADDAKYMKHLLVAAGTQKKLFTGLFIPNGIHLMENSEVLTNILKEQKTFVDNVTNYQINGISEQEMFHATEKESTIHAILTECDGVQAIESTHLTDKRGQWNIIVSKNKIQTVTKYITQNIDRIYKHKKNQTPQLVMYQQTTDQVGYSLRLSNTVPSRISTYAEVLRRRFSTKVTTNGINQQATYPTDNTNTNTPQQTASAKREKQSKPESNIDENWSKQNEEDHSSHESVELSSVETYSIKSADNDAGSLDTEGTDATKPQNNTKYSNNQTQKSDGLKKKVQQIQNVVNKQMQTVESTLQTKLQEIEDRQHQMITNMEDMIESKMEAIIDNRLKQASDEVADKVTKRTMKAMTAILNGKKPNKGPEICGIAPNVIGGTPTKATGNLVVKTNHAPNRQSNSKETTDINNYDCTETMDIETPQSSQNDSSHDNNPIESLYDTE